MSTKKSPKTVREAVKPQKEISVTGEPIVTEAQENQTILVCTNLDMGSKGSKIATLKAISGILFPDIKITIPFGCEGWNKLEKNSEFTLLW
jgi:hypothetical protein